jgi:hypothetical protein
MEHVRVKYCAHIIHINDLRYCYFGGLFALPRSTCRRKTNATESRTAELRAQRDYSKRQLLPCRGGRDRFACRAPRPAQPNSDDDTLRGDRCLNAESVTSVTCVAETICGRKHIDMCIRLGQVSAPSARKRQTMARLASISSSTTEMPCFHSHRASPDST